MTVTLCKCTRPTHALFVSTLRKCIIIFVSAYLTQASAVLAQLVLCLGLEDTVFLAVMERSIPRYHWRQRVSKTANDRVQLT